MNGRMLALRCFQRSHTKQQMRSSLRIASTVMISLKKERSGLAFWNWRNNVNSNSWLKFWGPEPQFFYYLFLPKSSGQGEQIVFLYKTHKASVLSTERPRCHKSTVSASRTDCFSMLWQKEEEGGVRRGTTASSQYRAHLLLFHSFE